MRISDWSSDVCASDLLRVAFDSTQIVSELHTARLGQLALASHRRVLTSGMEQTLRTFEEHFETSWWQTLNVFSWMLTSRSRMTCLSDTNQTMLTRLKSSSQVRSEEHTSELQSLMRISYAVFCLKKKKTNLPTKHSTE